MREEEVFVMSEGMCFGHWAIIYRKERSASAYALEDTDLFVLNESNFNECFNVITIFKKLEMHI